MIFDRKKYELSKERSRRWNRFRRPMILGLFLPIFLLVIWFILYSVEPELLTEINENYIFILLLLEFAGCAIGLFILWVQKGSTLRYLRQYIFQAQRDYEHQVFMQCRDYFYRRREKSAAELLANNMRALQLSMKEDGKIDRLGLMLLGDTQTVEDNGSTLYQDTFRGLRKLGINFILPEVQIGSTFFHTFDGDEKAQALFYPPTGEIPLEEGLRILKNKKTAKRKESL